MTDRQRSMCLRPEVLLVATGTDLLLRWRDDAVTLADVGSHVVERTRLYGSAALSHLALLVHEEEELHKALDERGWLEPGPGRPSTDNRVSWATPLIKVIERLAMGAAAGNPDGSLIAATSDEALRIAPGTTPQDAAQAVRFFLSRVDWFRLQAYSSALHLRREEIAIAGDRCPATEPPPLDDDDHRAVQCFRLEGNRWVPTSSGLPGSVPEPFGDHGDRLSAVQVDALQTQLMHAWDDGDLWCASGEFALPNLRFTPTPSTKPMVSRWCLGIDRDRSLAERKAMAEGVERFALGDVQPEELVCAPAVGLDGPHLDPLSIASYDAAQRQRLGLGPYDPAAPEWWVPGSGPLGPTWLPAALVFCPFGAATEWLAPGFSSSNGAAAHLDDREALRRAWLELVERDAFMRTYLRGAAPPRLRPRSLDTRTAQLLDVVASSADRVGIVLLHSSVGAPVIAACAWVGGRFCLGASADQDRAAATAKALTEVLVQVRAPYDGHRPEMVDVRTPEDHGRLYADEHTSASIAWLLDGPFADEEAPTFDVDAALAGSYYYVRPAGSWWVARALDPRLIQLTFGYDNEVRAHPAFRSALEVPIAEDVVMTPHPFP